MDNLFTPAQEAEFKNCAADFVYFCENYVKIVHPMRGLIEFKLYDFQKRYTKTIDEHRFVISKKFRQGGFTTTTLAWFLWRFIFKVDESTMFIAKSDREAIDLCHTLRGMYERLPGWMKVTLKRCNDHNVESQDSNNRIYFGTFQAACGRALTHFVIDEAAFISDMESHWKAIYPCLSTGGKCLVISSVNGMGNWFQETYFAAQENKNKFHIFHSEYTEHPDYDNDTWRENTMKNLGTRGWRQEVLCEFLPPRTWKQQIEQAEDFLCEISACEEAAFLARAEKKFKKEQEEKRHRRNEQKKDELWEVKTNSDPVTLLFEEFNWEDPLFKDCESRQVEPRCKPEVYQFQKLSREAIKAMFESAHEGWKLEDAKHPEFASNDGFVEIKDIADIMITICNDHTWAERYRKQQSYWKAIEDKIEYYTDPDMLALSGIIGKDEAGKICCSRPDLKILDRLANCGKFPTNINLSFLGGSLCINEVPTQIREEDVRDAYNGLYALTSHSYAIESVVSLLQEKLGPLFSVAEERSDGSE